MNKKTINNTIVFILIACFFAIGITGYGQEKFIGTFTSAAAGSGWFPIYAQMIIFMDKSDKVMITHTEGIGSIGNAKRMADGEVDFSLLSDSVALRSYQGIDDFEDEAFTDLRIMYFFSPMPFTGFVRADSEINSIEELEGKPFSYGATGLETEKIFRQLFEDGIGIKVKNFDGDMAMENEAVRANRILGYFRTGCPETGIVELSQTLDIRILDIDKKYVEKANEMYPGMYNHYIIPAGTYKGQDEPKGSLAGLLGSVSTPDVAQDIVYDMLKHGFTDENMDELKNNFPGRKDVFTIENIAELSLSPSFPVPLHAGAVQFFKEKGYEVPDSRIPPEYK
jgi:TRAP transporter TAXI family solute receptor